MRFWVEQVRRRLDAGDERSSLELLALLAIPHPKTEHWLALRTVLSQPGWRTIVGGGLLAFLAEAVWSEAAREEKRLAANNRAKVISSIRRKRWPTRWRPFCPSCRQREVKFSQKWRCPHCGVALELHFRKQEAWDQLGARYAHSSGYFKSAEESIAEKGTRLLQSPDEATVKLITLLDTQPPVAVKEVGRLVTVDGCELGEAIRRVKPATQRFIKLATPDQGRVAAMMATENMSLPAALDRLEAERAERGDDLRKLNQALKAAGISKARLAERLGLTKTAIIHWLNGQKPLPPARRQQIWAVIWRG